ncbi:hypothetical protein BDW72DRAFT_167455 [Aspergillus terricola var. indicus]
MINEATQPYLFGTRRAPDPVSVLVRMTSYLQLYDSRLSFCVIKNGGVAEKAITDIEAIKLVPLSALTATMKT